MKQDSFRLTHFAINCKAELLEIWWFRPIFFIKHGGINVVDKTTKAYKAFKAKVRAFIDEKGQKDYVDLVQLHEIDQYYKETETIIASREYNLTYGDVSDELYNVLGDLIRDDEIDLEGGQLALVINLVAGYALDLPIATEIKPYDTLHWAPVVFMAYNKQRALD